MSLEKNPSISVIVPAFNEEAIIGRCIVELADTIRRSGYSAEIIIVDDGSTDRTLSKARSFQGELPILRVLSFSRNYGKATALKEGMRAARGSTVAFFDADLQYDPADLVKMVSMLKRGNDIVTGRRDFGQYGRTRTAFSTIYNRMLRLIFRIEVADSNCGIKVLKRNLADPEFLFRYGTPLMMPLLKLSRRRMAEKRVSLRQRKVGNSKFFDSNSFLGGWRHIKALYLQSGMLLGLLANLPSEMVKARQLTWVEEGLGT